MIELPWGYVDTSVLVRRYVREAGTVEAIRLTSGHRVVVSAYGLLELASALHAKHRGGGLSIAGLRTALASAAKERPWWMLVEVTPSVLGRSEDILRRVAARAVDALHIASSLIFQESLGAPIPFLTADAKQRAAAEALGLDVSILVTMRGMRRSRAFDVDRH
jgi:uncharacterized protein